MASQLAASCRIHSQHKSGTQISYTAGRWAWGRWWRAGVTSTLPQWTRLEESLLPCLMWNGWCAPTPTSFWKQYPKTGALMYFLGSTRWSSRSHKMRIDKRNTMSFYWGVCAALGMHALANQKAAANDPPRRGAPAFRGGLPAGFRLREPNLPAFRLPWQLSVY